MNFLWLCLALAAFLCYVLSPPPLWVGAGLVGIMLLTGVLLYVS